MKFQTRRTLFALVMVMLILTACGKNQTVPAGNTTQVPNVVPTKVSSVIPTPSTQDPDPTPYVAVLEGQAAITHNELKSLLEFDIGLSRYHTELLSHPSSETEPLHGYVGSFVSDYAYAEVKGSLATR
jgi:hypothetical protein